MAKDIDAELAAFKAEISAIEHTDAPAHAPDADDDLGRAATPPPDERTFEDDDGTTYVWDATLRKFVAVGEAPAGPEIGAAPAPVYGVEEMTFEMDEEAIPKYEPPPAPAAEDDGGDGIAAAPPRAEPTAEAPGPGSAAALPQSSAEKKAQKKAEGAAAVLEKHAERQKRAAEAAERQKQWFDMKVNTSVYVTGLPQDVTEAELAQAFGKCGIIKEGDDKRPKIKIYCDKATGLPKGDGLVTFLKEPSVELALKILDGAPLRDDPKKVMSVSLAKFEMHGDTYVPKKKPPRKKRKGAAADEKILGWGGFDDQLKATQVTVVLKHMFHPDEFLEEPTLREDLETDIAAECARLGPLDKVRIFHQNPEGVATVKFRTQEAAEKCVEKMHGRFFGGRQLEAALWDGVSNFHAKVRESAEEQVARLERFAAEIEAS